MNSPTRWPSMFGKAFRARRPQRRRFLKNFLLSIFLLITGILGGELVGQLWYDSPLYNFEYRLLYISPGAIRNRDTFWTYEPNTRITETLVYKKPFGGFLVESACEYTTDENGFLENPGDSRHYNWLIVGDSYLAGQGGCSWMSELRRLAPATSIYNAALMGTGIEHWAKFLTYLKLNGYSFDRVLVSFIPDDFFRQATRWRETEVDCLRAVELCQPGYFYYPIVPGTNIAATSERWLRRSFKQELAYWWRRNLWVTYFLYSSVQQWRDGAPPLEIRASTVDAFEHIRNSGHPVQFLRFPEKDELAVGAKNARSLLVDAFFRDRNLSYDECALGYRDFLDYDGHPNASGYARLASCVAQHLKVP